ncbi:MAG: DUF261 domain-containing protein [Treponema sp.]|jgi:hypothetical protein|nr:DUF261 domain-containing protein [Treponema sp.]
MREGIQTHFTHEALRKEGCYFFALLRWAEILRGSSKPGNGFEFTDADVLKIFEVCNSKGWIEDDCFIVNPVAVLNHCIENPRFSSVFRSQSMPEEPLFAVYLKKPGHGHFVLGDKTGIIWDSLEPGRPGVRDYQVDSYRVII